LQAASQTSLRPVSEIAREIEKEYQQ
jgi:hypothetical protein